VDMQKENMNDGWKRLYDVQLQSEKCRRGVLWKYHWEVTIGKVKEQDDFYKIVCTDDGTELLAHVENEKIIESNGNAWIIIKES